MYKSLLDVLFLISAGIIYSCCKVMNKKSSYTNKHWLILSEKMTVLFGNLKENHTSNTQTKEGFLPFTITYTHIYIFYLKQSFLN